MEYIIKNRKPETLFRFFEELSAIPRSSGNEKAAADFVQNFSKERGLYCVRDIYNNVFVRKPASAGYEDHSPVILQGHLDMVCVKNRETLHDFAVDPLKLRINGDWLSADGTTLGADDGVAVATMLAVLDDNDLSHPTVECLFTVGEETGLVGALGFDTSVITAGTMLNIDTDDEGIAVNGCVGSADIEVRFEPEYVDVYGKCYTVTLGGFAGGHSGGDIEKERVNAIVLLFRLLSKVYELAPFNLVYVDGGSVCNAIPCEVKAVISVSDSVYEMSLLGKFFEEIKAEFTEDDKGGYLRTEKTKASEFCFTKMLTFKSTSNLISFFELCPCGVQHRNKEDLIFVESSANPATVHMENGCITAAFMNRATEKCMQDYMFDKIKRLARLTGGRAVMTGCYPGWAPVYDTPAQKLFIETYARLFPDAPAPQCIPIHAGLECGVIAGNLKKTSGQDIDAISFGPDIEDIHSPAERLSLASFERFWALLTDMLKAL